MRLLEVLGKMTYMKCPWYALEHGAVHIPPQPTNSFLCDSVSKFSLRTVVDSSLRGKMGFVFLPRNSFLGAGMIQAGIINDSLGKVTPGRGRNTDSQHKTHKDVLPAVLQQHGRSVDLRRLPGGARPRRQSQ